MPWGRSLCTKSTQFAGLKKEIPLKTTELGSRMISRIYSSVYAHPKLWMQCVSSTADSHVFQCWSDEELVSLCTPSRLCWQLDAVVRILSIVSERDSEFSLDDIEITRWIRDSLARAGLGIVRESTELVPAPELTTVTRTEHIGSLDCEFRIIQWRNS